MDLAEQNGDSFDQGIQLIVTAVLCAPQFLYRVELDPRSRTRGQTPPRVRDLNDFELASRLSYFLWNTMPDDELFDLAARGALHAPEALTGQVRRMLVDKRSRALVESFGDQWLQLRLLPTIHPDKGRFPGFDNELRQAMIEETHRVFEAIVREDRSVLEFLDARETFVNERLARHYGMPNVHGDEFRRVTLTDERRGGLLGQASILMVTSNPTRTSPVKRGKWVLEQILGTPPPPPPPDVPELKDDTDKKLTGTLRQRMEQHRANPNCATCHGRMDPLGFGLENFDAIGAWREQDGGLPIDASGTLPGGRSFDGPKGLRQILVSRRDDFVRNLAEKLLTYALGRGLDYYDGCALDKIVTGLNANDQKFSSLVIEIVRSDPFLKRRTR